MKVKWFSFQPLRTMFGLHPKPSAPTTITTPLEALFEALEGPLLLHARQLTGDSAIAEDLVQEAFLRLRRQRKKVLMPKVWLYRTIDKLAMDHEREKAEKSARRDTEGVPVGAEYEIADALSDDVIAHHERSGLTWLLIQDLNPLQREVLQLRLEENLTYSAIAERLGLSVTHVGVLLHYSIGGLAEEFAKLEFQQ